jgi:hypothetical protein
MLTIHDLQVHFDVTGEGDAATFSRMFAEHISRWSQDRDMNQARRRELDRERSLGDQETAAEEVGW